MLHSAAFSPRVFSPCLARKHLTESGSTQPALTRRRKEPVGIPSPVDTRTPSVAFATRQVERDPSPRCIAREPGSDASSRRKLRTRSFDSRSRFRERAETFPPSLSLSPSFPLSLPFSLSLFTYLYIYSLPSLFFLFFLLREINERRSMVRFVSTGNPVFCLGPWDKLTCGGTVRLGR